MLSILGGEVVDVCHGLILLIANAHLLSELENYWLVYLLGLLLNFRVVSELKGLNRSEDVDALVDDAIRALSQLLLDKVPVFEHDPFYVVYDTNIISVLVGEL